MFMIIYDTQKTLLHTENRIPRVKMQFNPTCKFKQTICSGSDNQITFLSQSLSTCSVLHTFS